MKTIQNKIQRTGRMLSNCLNIGVVILCVAVIVQIALLAYIQITQSVPSGIVVEVAPFVNVIDNTVGNMTILLAGNSIIYLFLIPILFIASTIFKDISRDYTPFLPKHIARLKTIAKLMLGIAVIPPIVQMILTPFLEIEGRYISRFDEVHFIFAAILYFLAQIFDYGRLLQQQSDETL